MSKRSIIRLLTVMLVLLVVLWGIILYVYVENNSRSGYYGIVYERDAPEFTLIGQNGAEVSLSDFDGKVVLLFFGYTHCPDICPMTMSVMNSVLDKLGDDADKVQVLFVTVDPERDTQEKIRDYVPYYNKSFIGLTGSPDEIDKVADDYNIFYGKEQVQSESEYLMGHNSSVLLITPEGEIFLRYPQNKMDPALIADDIKRVL